MKKKFIFIYIYITLLFIFYCHTAYAKRPFSTEDATVADKGALEIEAGFEYTRQNNSDNNYNILVVPCYGLTENIQLGVEIPFDIIRPKDDANEEGLGDITLVGKTLIFPEKEKTPSFLLKTAVKLETGDEDKGLGSGDEDVSFIFAATKSLGQNTIHANIGYTFVGNDFDDTLKDLLIYGVALEYFMTDELSLVSEIYVESDDNFNKDSHTINPLIGLTYQATEKIRFDAAFKTGIRYNQKTEYGIISGISISF